MSPAHPHVASRPRPPIGQLRCQHRNDCTRQQSTGRVRYVRGRSRRSPTALGLEAARLASHGQLFSRCYRTHAAGTRLRRRGVSAARKAGRLSGAVRPATFASGERQTGQWRLPRRNFVSDDNRFLADAVRRHWLCVRCASPLPSHLTLNRSDERSLDVVTRNQCRRPGRSRCIFSGSGEAHSPSLSFTNKAIPSPGRTGVRICGGRDRKCIFDSAGRYLEPVPGRGSVV